MKRRANHLPKLSFATGFAPGLAEQGAGDLLHLVDEKGEHHEGNENQAEIFCSQPIIVLEIVALIFQSVESLVFDFPPTTPSTHDLIGIVASDLKIGNPGEILGPIAIGFPVFEDVDQEVLIGLVEWNIVHIPKEMVNPWILLILDFVHGGLAVVDRFGDAAEEKGVIALFDSEDKMAVVLLEIPDVWSVGAQAILDDDHLEMRMIYSEFAQPTPAGIAFTIVFGVPVLVADGLGRQRDHLSVPRMDDNGSQGLEMVSFLSGLRSGLFQTAGGEALFGRKVTGSIDGDQIAAVDEFKTFEDFPPLGMAKDRFERRPQGIRINAIETSAHLGVTGNALDPVD